MGNKIISEAEDPLFISDLRRTTLCNDGRTDSISLTIYRGRNAVCPAINETYRPQGRALTMDFSDIVRPFLYPSDPGNGSVIHDNYVLEINFCIDQVCSIFNVYGFDRTGLERLSDIDFLRVPPEYIIPVTSVMNPYGIAMWMLTDGNKTIDSGRFEQSEFPCTAFLPFPQSQDHLRASVVSDEKTLFGPMLQLSPGHFEQYLFANDYGGFDNIPMDGKREYSPDHEFNTGLYSGRLKATSSKREDKWVQNSGFQTRATIETLSRLVCSRHIWHLKDGIWSKIVITSSQVSHSSADGLHSMSFEYKYVDEN